jgi:hypothetical protein
MTWAGVGTAAVVAMVVLTAGEILYKTTATAHVLGGMVYAAAPGALWPLCGVVAGLGAVLALASGRVSPRTAAAVVTPTPEPATREVT